MKNIFLFALLLTSCTRIVPLKNQYDEQPRIAVINKPLQEVLNSFATLALNNGYPVKNTDPRTGLITLDQTTFDGHGGFESKDGRIPNPNAYIVTERFSDEYPDRTDKYTFVANWNLLITPIDNNTTQVRIKLYDAAAFSDEVTLKGKSTGKFEKMILEELSK
jgi:hypothetical protein